MLKTETIEYYDGDVLLEGFYAYDTTSNEKRPAILVSHDWSGKNEFVCEKAKKLAELGYVGFALDMFGKGITGTTIEEKSALIQPFVQDRAKLLKRMMAAFETLKKLDSVDTNQIGAIGFCFGGLCVLDLARSGADVKATVSFHGLLNAPENKPTHTISGRVLALHGFDDPMVTPEQVLTFAKEMTDAKADWEIDMYGHTKHAFTNPKAHDEKLGTVYNQKAAKRSWIAMKECFKEVFGE